MQSAIERLEHHALRVVVTWLAAASLYCLLAAVTIQATSLREGIATVWPANAVLVAMLLSEERPSWISVLSGGFVGNFAANMLTRGIPLTPLFFGAADLVEVVVAVSLLRGRQARFNVLSSPATVGRFIVAAGLVAPVVSGLVGAGAATVVYHKDFANALVTWVLSDGVGLLIFTPVLLAVFNGDYVRSFREQSWQQRGEAAALLALTAAMATLVFFFAHRPLLFMLFGPVMLVTFRVGRLGTKLAVMLIAVIGAAATMAHRGPIPLVTTDPAEQAQLFQTFIAVLLLTSLPVAAELSARRRITQELAEREREMSRRAATDSLTGLRNRAAFEDCVDPLLANPVEAPLCLLALDLDNFKRVNDQWGHHAGDLALVHLGTVLRAHLRERDVVGRIGGDEFLVLLPRTSAKDAEAIAGRIREGMRRAPLSLDGKTEILLTISCGVTCAKPGQDYNSLVRQADRALYLAKDAGRNAVRFVA